MFTTLLGCHDFSCHELRRGWNLARRGFVSPVADPQRGGNESQDSGAEQESLGSEVR